jgi:hypothetical protein
LEADSNNKKQTIVQDKNPFRVQKLKKNAKIVQKSRTNESRAGGY